MINVFFYIFISSVKWVIWKTLIQTQQTQCSLPILWGHLAHFEPSSGTTITKNQNKN